MQCDIHAATGRHTFMWQPVEHGKAQHVDEAIAHWLVLFFFFANVTLRINSPQLQLSSDGFDSFALIAMC